MTTGSIFGSLEVLADRSVLRLDYIRDPSIPDWCSFSSRTNENGDVLASEQKALTPRKLNFGSPSKS